MIYRPIFPILYSCVSTAAVLIVPHIFFRPHPPLNPSYHIYFVFSILLPLCHISVDAVSIAPHLRRYLYFHTYTPPLSYSMSNFAVLLNLRLSWCSHPPRSSSSRISASAILIVLHICRVFAVAVSILPRLCHCHDPFLIPRSVPTSSSSCVKQQRLLGAAFHSVGIFCSYQWVVDAIPVGWHLINRRWSNN